MNRLIVEFKMTDNCTYWATDTIPVSTEGSKKQLVQCLTDANKRVRKNPSIMYEGVIFFGKPICTYELLLGDSEIDENFQVFTLDEYFKD